MLSPDYGICLSRTECAGIHDCFGCFKDQCYVCRSSLYRPNEKGDSCVLCAVYGCLTCNEVNKCTTCGYGYRRKPFMGFCVPDAAWTADAPEAPLNPSKVVELSWKK